MHWLYGFFFVPISETSNIDLMTSPCYARAMHPVLIEKTVYRAFLFFVVIIIVFFFIIQKSDFDDSG